MSCVPLPPASAEFCCAKNRRAPLRAPAKEDAMHCWRRDQLSDPALLQSLHSHFGHETTAIAATLADLDEIDRRQLYRPAGYSSLFAYCLGELPLSEDAAYKRIQAARAARRFPTIFEAVAAGRLHLTAVGLPAPPLTPGKAAPALAAAP